MKKTTKRLLCALLAIGLVCCLWGCDAENDEPKETTGSQQNVQGSGNGEEPNVSESTVPTQPVVTYPTPSQELSGELGGMTYHLSLDGTLTITGEGYWTDCVEYDDLSTDAPWYPEREAILKIVISEGIENVPTHAFYGCTNVLRIELPETMTKIGNLSFSYCANLKAIEFPDAITSIGRRSFVGALSLADIKWPENLEFIGQDAFSGCAIETLVLPESVETIQMGAFASCKLLKEVTIPSKVTEIRKGTFKYCDSLTTVHIGEGVDTIGENAFYSCDALEVVSIPGGVKNVGESAFEKCVNLKRVEIHTMYAAFDLDVFKGCENVCVYGPPKSTAAGYCDTYGIPFEALT